MMRNEEPGLMQGWLTLVSYRPPGEMKTYCRVHNDRFLVESDLSEGKRLHDVPLTRILNVVSVNIEGKPGFEVICCSQLTLRFRAETLHDVHKWILALLTEPTLTDHVSMRDFRKIQEIGRGSSGRVILARKIDSGQLFAIKSIRKRRSNTGQGVMAERNVLLRTNHPFVTRLHYAFQTPEKFYLVLEYVEGGDLAHIMKDPAIRFSKGLIKLFLAELCLALTHLHKMGILYRDLKPENVLVSSKGHLQLTDFGLAKDLTNSTGRMSLCGTCEYIAPEMLRGESYGFGIDWWALGVLAYRLHVGVLPFTGDNQRDLFNKIISDDPDLPHTLDMETRIFLSELLEKNPNNRLGVKNDPLKHKYFEGINWDLVLQMKVDTNFTPPRLKFVSDDATEVSSLDEFAGSDVASYMLSNFSFCCDGAYGPDEIQ